MSKGWPRERLGDLFDFKNGRAFKKEEWRTSGLPIIRIQNLNNEAAPFNYFAGSYSPDILVESGDLLFSWSGTVGSSFGSHLWCGKTGVLNQHIFKIGLRSAIGKRYAFHGLRYITEEIEQSVNGAVGLVHITKAKLNEFTLPVPSLPEQQRIVGLLDEAFACIAVAKANTEKNIRNARGLFDSHLQSIFTRRGPGWAEKRLEDIGKTQTGSTPKTVDRSNFGRFIPFVKPGDFKADGSLDYDKDGLSESGAKSARKVPPGSVLMVCIGTIGKCGYCDRFVTTNQQINAITPSDGSSSRFIYYQMRTEAFQRKVIRCSGQTTLPIINKSKWSALTVWLPSKVAEQEMIAAELDALAEKTQRLARVYERKLALLDALKKSLLHQAFSGQL